MTNSFPPFRRNIYVFMISLCGSVASRDHPEAIVFPVGAGCGSALRAFRNEWADRPDGCAGSRRIGAQDRPPGSDGA